MFFPKLKHLCNYPGVNKFAIEQLDHWLAVQHEMHYDYLNPIEFINEVKVNRKIGLFIFALAANEDFFTKVNDTPPLRIKYILSCPYCDSHFKTYYSNKDIPNTFVNCCEDHCDPFNPSFHPEKIEIYYELLEYPIIMEDSILEVYEKVSSPPLVAGDKDFIEAIWEIEERSFKD